ncbi:hypothetical protein [Rubrivirga sp. S365]|uniref:hypothetical protein n=1 Tax=Rubrivirga sp. S365 TaxID=3076080 RepID=UPI0028D4973D|nr:hypothetical protein [Rubrivirga sp. S365]
MHATPLRHQLWAGAAGVGGAAVHPEPRTPPRPPAQGTPGRIAAPPRPTLGSGPCRRARPTSATSPTPAPGPALLRCALVLLCLAAAAPAFAQTGGAAVRRDTFALAAGQTAAQLRARPLPGTATAAVFRDTAFVALDADAFSVDAAGRFALAEAPEALVVVAVAYRVLDAPGPVRARLPPADSLRALYAPDTTRAGRPEPSAAAARPPPAIRTRGSITRGVVAGSNRDVSVTSGLRLALDGDVAPGVALRAALTDEDTPILPEGTTQQLSDLDRVYVEVDGPGVRARLGDVDLALAGTAFAPLERQVQGALVEATVPAFGLVAGGRVVASGSATRGLFRSQDIAAIEGVQGPYRLDGRGGEAFVVVVPGSERVYLDGRLLRRGAGADYTVDYGTGELTFTPAHLITAERRITVDFEYTAGGAGRTLAVGGADLALVPDAAGVGRVRLGARVLREADGAGFAESLGLTPAEVAQLRAAGTDDVLVSGAQRVPTFDAQSPFVLYTTRDTVVAGEPVQIFVPAAPPDTAFFRVRFSRVAPGAGTYRRANRVPGVVQARNGVVYEYVGPGRGDALPARVLPRPTSRTLLDLTAAADVLPGLEAFGEVARSVDDANTLAPGGGAGAGAYEVGLRLAPRDVGGGALSGTLRHRARADAFRPLDRVRGVDFNRRWNLARAGTPFGSALDTLGETVTEAAVRWAVAGGAAEAEAGRLALGGFRSDRGALGVRLGQTEPGPLGLDLDLRLAGARSGGAGALAERLGTGFFREGRALVSRAVGPLTPSVAVKHERREQGGEGAAPPAGPLLQDSLLAASYGFWAVRPALSATFPGLDAAASVELRQESEPLGPRGGAAPLADAARALTVETTARARRGTAQADVRVAYRRKRYRSEFGALGREDAQSVAVRLGARAAPLRQAVRLRAVYDALTERSPIRQETYVLVGADLGEFVWRDGGGEPRAGEPDGVAQVDEFFPETTPLEGEYLRTFVPSPELVPTVGVGLDVRLDVEPGRLASGDGLAARVARAVALRTTLDVDERTRNPDVLAVLLLAPGALQQTGGAEAGTVNGRFRVEQELVLFPDRPGAGGRLVAEHARSTSQLAVGLERRLVQALRAEATAQLHPALRARVEAAWTRRQTLSEAFASRTFDLRGVSAEPSVVWTPTRALAVTLAPVLADRTDALAPADRPSGAAVVRVPVEARLTRAGRLSVAVRAERADVRLRGEAPAGLALFELTEGRGPGTSYLWGADAQVGLSDALRATLRYDGRAPADAPVVQTVRLELSATF